MNPLTFIASGIRTATQWASHCPIKATLFAALFLSTLIVGFTSNDPECLITALAVLILTYIVWAFVFLIDMKRLVGVFLAAALLLHPPQVRAVPLIIIGGVCVLIGGGIIGCRAIKCGKKVARNREHAMTNLAERVALTGESGALFTWPEDSNGCYVQRLQPSVPVTFTIDVLVTGKTNCTTVIYADVGSQYGQTLDELKEELASHGLSWPDSPQPSFFYERDGAPCDEQDAGIALHPATHVIITGSCDTTVTVEYSNDLIHWAPLVAAEAAIGQTVRVSDVSNDGAAFYRAKQR